MRHIRLRARRADASLLAETEQQLFQLSRHCDVNALCLTDPLEQQLPSTGIFRLIHGEETLTLQARNARELQTFANAFEQRQENLRLRLARVGVSLLSLATNDDPISLLNTWFGRAGGTA